MILGVVVVGVMLVVHWTSGGAKWKQLNLRVAFTVTDVIFIFISVVELSLSHLTIILCFPTGVFSIFIFISLSDLILNCIFSCLSEIYFNAT